jgi:LuxR family transcriptional regulator of spore coat protein
VTRELTARQRQILRLKANGNTSGEIAAFLGVTKATIDKIMGRIYRAYGARNESQAVAIGLALGDIGIHEIHIPVQHQEEAA